MEAQMKIFEDVKDGLSKRQQILTETGGQAEVTFCENNFTNFEGVLFLDGCEGFVKNLPAANRNDAKFLEIGCGTGCMSVIYYLRNKANLSYVLATDINHRALDNTSYNFNRYNVPGEVRYSDVFDSVAEDEKFDLIFWNFPFVYLPTDAEVVSTFTVLDLSMVDAGYEAAGRFMAGAHRHLRPGGKAILAFSRTLGRPDILENVAKKENRRLEFIWSENTVQSGSTEIFDLVQVIAMD
ncbi:release factor glutamine methyltransferase-like [Tubulanus polymorphus]|uniref:release factor glutamine methyltransferase-like n=1 Tax=Tubulanus polymorphus TaxID=672921 RepID=UPI003DA57DAB